jgi:hypothetical protein
VESTSFHDDGQVNDGVNDADALCQQRDIEGIAFRQSVTRRVSLHG